MTDVSKPLPSPPSDSTNKENGGSPVNPNKRLSKETPRQAKDQQNAKYDEDEEFEFFNEFERDKVKGVIHFITAELKSKGTDVEYLMIPFRPQQTNEKLLKLLNSLFPMGNGQPVSEKQQLRIITKTEPPTLFQGLKYIWCRLQGGEVIGWKSYLEFKIREKSKDYPPKAFLEIMPQCLASPSHASIVYDFFDLIISMASNSRVNKMSARKISKMCSIWAFGKPIQNSSMADYDFTSTSSLPNNSFQDGSDQWIPGTDAIFHLLLAFLKSFVPQDLETSQLPMTLKSLLFNNEYPPKESTAYSSETILTIPLVTLKTDKFSRKPWQLLERCNAMLDFSDYNAFEAREDYALLKSLFKKKNNVEGISRKMSQESRRLMKLMSTKHSTFQAGWTSRKCLPNANNLPEAIEIGRVDIDDYFIWAWLSTLSYEQTSERKNIFGRSLILEFEFDGFKKWVLFQECDITLESKKCLKSKDDQSPNAPPNLIPGAKETAGPPKSRNITPAYEKFQKQVVHSGEQEEARVNDMYHTVISKQTLEKNSAKHNVNLHSLEQKISKWNPLNKVRKKSRSDSTASSGEMKEKGSLSTPEPAHQAIYHTSPDPYKQNVINQPFPAIEPDAKLPEVDLLENKKDILPVITAANISSPKLKRTPPPPAPLIPTVSPDEIYKNDETMEELRGMVEQMMSDDNLNLSFDHIESEITLNSENETFESLTKFDQYKPSTLHDVDTPTSSSSAVTSLNLKPNISFDNSRTINEAAPINSYAPQSENLSSLENRNKKANAALSPRPQLQYPIPSTSAVNLQPAQKDMQPYSNTAQQVQNGQSNAQKSLISHPPSAGISVNYDAETTRPEVPRDVRSEVPKKTAYYGPQMNKPMGVKQMSRDHQPPLYKQPNRAQNAQLYPPHRQNDEYGDNRAPPVMQEVQQRGRPFSPPQQQSTRYEYGHQPFGPPLQQGEYEYGQQPPPQHWHSERQPYRDNNGLQGRYEYEHRGPPVGPSQGEPHYPSHNYNYVPPPQGVGQAKVAAMPPLRYQEHHGLPMPVNSGVSPRLRNQGSPIMQQQHQNSAAPMRSHIPTGKGPFYGKVDPSSQGFFPVNIPTSMPKRISHAPGSIPAQNGAVAQEFYLPDTPHGNKLHGGHINKQQERKNLHKNIRNGNFGI